MVFDYKGNKIYYSVFGKGSPLVFLHGWMHSSEIWKGMIERLGGKHTCIAVDLPGFGQSPVPQKVFTVGDYAEVIENLLADLELKDVTIIGHSLGGRVAIKLAAGKNTENIRQIVLIDSGGLRPDKNLTMRISFVLAKIGNALFSLPGLTKFRSLARKSLYGAIGENDYLQSGELKQTFLNVINEDLTEDCKRIQRPTLIIWGDQDQEVPLKYGIRMHRLIKDSKLRILNFAGHSPFLEYPDKVSRIIRSI